MYYLRPNLLCTKSLVLVQLLLLLFPWRSDGSASAHATVNVLLFFLRWFQYLIQKGVGQFGFLGKQANVSWMEHSGK